MNLTPSGRRDSLMSFILRDFELHLATNLTEEKDGEIKAKELSEEGYSPIVLTKKDWTLLKRNETYVVKSDPKFFKFEKPHKSLITGFYLTRPDSDEILYGEEFSDGPYDILRPNESVKVIIIFDNPPKKKEDDK